MGMLISQRCAFYDLVTFFYYYIGVHLKNFDYESLDIFFLKRSMVFSCCLLNMIIFIWIQYLVLCSDLR